jgi:hypothetical protein
MSAHALRGQLQIAPEAGEGASAKAVRVLYFALTGALEAALTRGLEDVVTILRYASQPLAARGESRRKLYRP